MQLENKAEIKTLLPVMKKDFAFVKAFMAREGTHTNVKQTNSRYSWLARTFAARWLHLQQKLHLNLHPQTALINTKSHEIVLAMQIQ